MRKSQGPSHTDVRLTAYDASARTLSYTVQAAKFPPFIERLTNTWTVTADGPERCTLETHVEISIAESMSGSEQANKAVDAMPASGTGAATNLRTYIESDSYHARPDHV